MYTYLKQHPEIYLALYKEPNFFCKDLTQSDYNIREPELYASLFAFSGDKKCIGEGSVWYLTSGTAASEISAFNPSSKIIVMLRNPVDMIYSLHGLYVRTGNEDIPDFEKALAAQPLRKNGISIPEACYFPEGLFYTEVGTYYDKIKRFTDIFGMARVHFVIFDDFAADTARSYRETLAFLEVADDFQAEFDLKKADGVIRKRVYNEIRHAHPEVKKKLASKTGLRAHKGPPRETLSPEMGSRLRSFFKEDIEKTSRLINQDLTHWTATG